MRSRMVQRFALAAALIGGVGAFAASTAEAARPVRRTTRPQVARGFNLFAGAANVLMNVNRVQCNVNTIGETCVDPNNSPVLGGGFWPRGTPDQYIFNSGLQIAAIIPGADQPNFPWPGDTVGAFFFDPRGDQAHGEGRTNVFNGLNLGDLAEWPSAGFVNDPTLFSASLLGRKTVSQQDTWVRYWDGNTQLTTGRQHPMGLLVEQRGLAWNFPSGNQDIIYFLYRFINATARDPSRYAGLASVGYSAADIAEIVAIANEFQDRAEAAFNVQIPDQGFPWSQTFAAFAQDPDVGQAGANYSTAILPFSIALAYKSDFLEPTWSFPPEIFGAPFAAAPGFEGVKYLRSPIIPGSVPPREFGISMFGNTTNGPPFPDRVGVQALWRGLSGNLLPVDGTCSVPFPQQRRLCALVQTAQDTRFFESSGPFTLNPGESAVIVVAYVHAAPVGSVVTPFIGGDMKPGIPGSGARIIAGLDPIRDIDRAAGWVSFVDRNANGDIEQTEVTTVPRSLLDKSLVAQAVFDNKFLLPFAPEAPLFFLVPGDAQVSIAWQKSDTETGGDPFFAVASNVTSPLFDRNFRKFDVEGYRVWRGRSEAQMEVIVQFDYAGTVISDFTGQFFNENYGNRCAPELGVTGSCPVNFALGERFDILLAGNVMQIPPGGRVQLASGDIFNVIVDTAVTGGGTGFPGLTDTRVPFVYVDEAVRNGFRYFYSVTAFDVNSVKSGPSSLESPLITKSVTPRATGSNALAAVVVTGMFGADGTTELDPRAPFPTIDPANGTFSGIIPPANAGNFDFLASVAEALPPGDYVARIDSVEAGWTVDIGFPDVPELHMSFISGTDVFRVAQPIITPSFFADVGEPGTDISVSLPLVPYDSARSRRLGIAFTRDTRMPVEFSNVANPIVTVSPSIALTQGRFGHGNQASRYLSHSRWWNAAASEPADPTINPFGSAANTNGTLTGVSIIYSPLVYRLPFTGGAPNRALNRFNRGYGYAQTTWYPADFLVTWGAGASITVRDSTHRTTLPFSGALSTGYGFLNQRALVLAGVTAGDLADGTGTPGVDRISYHSLYALDPVCDEHWWFITCARLERTAQLQPIDYTNDGVADGNGIALIINGEAFFMLMTTLPAAGTQWRFRAVGGAGMSATCTPPLPAVRTTDLNFGAQPTDCSGYSYTPTLATRSAYAPGVQYKIRVTRGFEITDASGDISRIHTVPDPYYVTNQLEITANTKVLRFVNLPDRAIIRIYSASGILVSIITHNDPTGGGEAVWNLRNRNQQFVASGVYFYHAETPDGREKIGRFTVVNFAQ